MPSLSIQLMAAEAASALRAPTPRAISRDWVAKFCSVALKKRCKCSEKCRLCRQQHGTAQQAQANDKLNSSILHPALLSHPSPSCKRHAGTSSHVPYIHITQDKNSQHPCHADAKSYDGSVTLLLLLFAAAGLLLLAFAAATLLQRPSPIFVLTALKLRLCVESPCFNVFNAPA